MMCYKSAVTFICFFFLTSPSVCLENGPQKDTYKEAMKQCSKLGTRYKISDPFLGPLVLDFQKLSGLNIWLPYRRVVSDNYSWVDGTQAASRLNSLGHKLGYSCGAIDLENAHYDFQPCHLGGSSFICQIPGCSTCSSFDIHRFKCLVLRNECFTYHCGSASWYRAREICKQQGGDLAVVKDMLDIEVLHQLLERANDNPCSTSWIGLNREQWKTEDGGEPTLSFWREEEPSLSGTCSIISMENLCFTWRAVHCHDKYWYYCGKNETSATLFKRSAGDKSIDKNGATYIIINTKILVVILIFVFMVIVLQTYILTRKKKEKNSRDFESRCQSKQGETEELITQNITKE